MWSLEKLGCVNPGCGCLGTNPLFQLGSVWPLRMERILWLQFGLDAVEVLQEQLSLRAPEWPEILLEWLLCIKSTGISELFLLPAVTAVPVSWLCWACLHTAQASHRFPRFEPKLPIHRTLPISNTGPHVFAVKPSPKSQPCLIFQFLFDLCCCLVFSCYWEKGLWFLVMAAQQGEIISWTTKSLFSYMFLDIEKWGEKGKQINFQSVKIVPQ